MPTRKDVIFLLPNLLSLLLDCATRPDQVRVWPGFALSLGLRGTRYKVQKEIRGRGGQLPAAVICWALARLRNQA
jgi:hypothetical protein